MRIDRRKFLRASGWTAIGVTVAASLAYPLVRSAMPALPTTADPEIDDGWAWVQALPDGRIRFFCPRMEMGQGASLGLAQVVAEELNVAQADIVCVLPRTDQTPPFKLTTGSEGVASFFEPVSRAAALLRETLRDRAAEAAQIDRSRLRDAERGFLAPGGAPIDFAEIAGGRPILLTASSRPAAAPARYATRPAAERRAIGHPWRHHELEDIVTGRALYSRDVVVPGMLFGQVLRPPAIGARLESVDVSAAEALPHVVATVVDRARDFVGVVSEDPFLLDDAAEVIEIAWSAPPQQAAAAEPDIERLRAQDGLAHVVAAAGAIDDGRARAQVSISARYDTPLAAHAAMEPRAAVAEVGEDRASIWCGSQDPFFVQGRVAELTGLKRDSVVVSSLRMGGGFGGRIACRAAEEAAALSQAVGRPVRVQWRREDEQQSNYFQPAFSHAVEAGVAADGRISHWVHDCAAAPILTGPISTMGGPYGEVVARAMDWFVADGGSTRGLVSPYRVADHRVRFESARTQTPVGAWRGLGSAPNAFAIESMMDELAVAVRIDPLKLRLDNLGREQERLAGALRRVAEIADWGRPSEDGVGRGLASAVYKDQTPVAIVAEVAVDAVSGAVRVRKIWCAQDCGMVVNPDQVESLVMGNLVWGCGVALSEKVSIEAGVVRETNLHAYRMLRHEADPEMMIDLIASDAPPVAVGESALAPVAPAIANAVFAATGRRVRRLPILRSDLAAPGDAASSDASQ